MITLSEVIILCVFSASVWQIDLLLWMPQLYPIKWILKHVAFREC